jgi:hypothetical protein
MNSEPLTAIYPAKTAGYSAIWGAEPGILPFILPKWQDTQCAAAANPDKNSDIMSGRVGIAPWIAVSVAGGLGRRDRGIN